MDSVSTATIPPNLYIYVPNRVAALVFTFAFALSAGAHIWQCWFHKSWKLAGLQPVCAMLFTAGFALRVVGSFDNYVYDENDNKTLILYILSQVFIYISPPLLELANYHVLGRLFYYAPRHLPLSPSKVTATFGGVILLIETLNGIGVAFASNPTTSNPALGKALILTALALQLLVICFFFIIAGRFHMLSRTLESRRINTLLTVLYISMGLIVVRSIYRLVEYIGGAEADIDDPVSIAKLSPLRRHEWYFYVFEATLMFINSVLWNAYHAGRFLPRERCVYLSEDGKHELVGEEVVEHRSTGKTVAHFLSLGQMYRKKREIKRVEEASDEL